MRPIVSGTAAHLGYHGLKGRKTVVAAVSPKSTA